MQKIFNFFKFLLFIVFFASMPINAYSQEAAGGRALSEEAKNDLKVYNENRKELGMGLFYNFSEMYKESFPKFEELYAKGDPVASYYYAECLYNGWGVFPRNEAKANEIFEQVLPRIRRLVFAGDGLISYTMYQAYLSGYGVPRDRTKSMFYLEASIKKGYGMAIFAKAKMQEETGQFQQAFNTYLQSSQSGNPEANFRLGLIYETGEGHVGQDYTQAVIYYERAAKYGHIKAMANLGNLYYNGLGVEQNLPEALRYFQKAAEKESPAAINSLGVMYLRGEGGLPKDLKTAFLYFSRAAYYGDETAYNNLGNMYFNGIYVKEDKAKAFSYYLKAAEKENPEAMYKVALMYEKGVGTTANQRRADAWYKLIEKKGYDLNDFK